MSSRTTRRRIPLTITLSPEDFRFVESCASIKELRSLDQFFEASLAFYRRHLEAINAYAEDQGSKGYSRREILESIELETLVTRARAASRARGKRAARRKGAQEATSG